MTRKIIPAIPASQSEYTQGKMKMRLTDHEQRQLDQQSGEEMDRRMSKPRFTPKHLEALGLTAALENLKTAIAKATGRDVS